MNQPMAIQTSADEELMNLIRSRAFQLYEERGRQDGYALEDWLQAEGEVLSGAMKAAA